MQEDEFFPFIVDEINEVVNVLTFRCEWLTPIESIQYDALIEKLSSHHDFINFIQLSKKEIDVINDSIHFRIENELADEDFEYLSELKIKFLKEDVQ